MASWWHYNFFRDYDPKTGRYLEADPIGQARALNLFEYVGSAPTSGSDPLGLFPHGPVVRGLGSLFDSFAFGVSANFPFLFGAVGLAPALDLDTTLCCSEGEVFQQSVGSVSLALGVGHFTKLSGSRAGMLSKQFLGADEIPACTDGVDTRFLPFSASGNIGFLNAAVRNGPTADVGVGFSSGIGVAFKFFEVSTPVATIGPLGDCEEDCGELE